MASLAYNNYIHFTLLILNFIYTSMMKCVLSSQSPNSTLCLPFDCGDHGLTIHYPFWHQSQFEEHCGYPGFNISCNHHHNPMLHLSSDFYIIKTINYSSKSLTLSYHELADSSSCPKIHHNISANYYASSSIFFNSSTPANKRLHFFYNCSLYPPSLPHIECLMHDAKRSYAFAEAAIPEFDWQRYCESLVTVPVIDKGVVDGDANDVVELLKDGFKVTWVQQPDEACHSCEASGGFCGYGNGTAVGRSFFCTTCAAAAKQSHKYNCEHKPGTTTNLAETNYVTIGAMIFVGLVMAAAAAAFYFVKKKKVASYKPV